MVVQYHTKGVCARRINFVIENGVIKSVTFEGGCHGNLQGVSKLVEGMQVKDVIDRLKGIRCEKKSTSCPDQLATALEKEIIKADKESA